MTTESNELADRRESRKVVLVERLIAAAERLFAQGLSYPEITVHRLATEAGVSRSGFYTYFEDKAELLHSWFATIRRELVDVDDAWWAVRENSTQADLRAALHRITTAYAPHTALMAAMYDLAASDGDIREQISALESQRSTRLTAHIERGQREGWIDPELAAPETAAWLTLTGARGYQQMVGDGPEQLTVDQFADLYAQHVWFVLYDTAPRARR